MKKIHHVWKETAFLEWTCQRPLCQCVKKRVKDNIRQCFYFDVYGHQLPCLPECKTTFHNDKIL